MPRKPINYSKTVIYKIVCNDLNIKYCYVGSTTDFSDRKSSHKVRCTNPNNAKHNIYIYRFIRENGGWQNWSMIEVERYDKCIDNNDKLKRERYWMEKLNASLNCKLSIVSQQETREKRNQDNECECGGKYTYKHKSEHNKSKKHQKYINSIH